MAKSNAVDLSEQMRLKPLLFLIFFNRRLKATAIAENKEKTMVALASLTT